MARKGQFKKGGGRVGGRTRARRTTTAIVVAAPRAPSRRRRAHVARKAPRRSRRSRGGGGVNLLHLGIATAGLGYALSENGIKSARDVAAKIPGAKTFGAPAAVGVAALAVDKFLYRNRWLKLLGVAGVVLAAAKVGEQNRNFKFVGDDDGVADLDDVGDDDDDIAGDDSLDY